MQVQNRDFSIKIETDAPADEEAAALAAIAAYMTTLETEKPKPVTTDSAWLESGRIESAGIKGSAKQGHGSLWSRLALTFFACTFTAGGAQAQDSPEIAVAPRRLYPASTQSVFAPDRNQPVIPAAPVLQPSGSKIRVQLASGLSRMDLDTPDGASIYSLADGSLVARTGTQSSFTLNLQQANLALRGKSERDRLLATGQSVRNVTYQVSPAALESLGSMLLPLQKQERQEAGYLVVPESASGTPLVGFGGKYYRGALQIKPMGSGSQMRVINEVPLEDYLLSVVPSEVPSRWPAEVLKAQAIAARSYAVANLGKHRVDGYDVKDTVEDQVYSGVQSENQDTNRAVSATDGLVLKHNSKVISAFFHSTSGGATELSEAVWGKSLPYLKAVVDYDDESPHFNWKRPVDGSKLQALLKMPGENILGLFVVSRYPGDSQRVKNVMIVGENTSRLLAGQDLRRLLNLPSTQFSLYQEGSAYVFAGRGFGHGLGLSQWGAKALADRGYNAGQILSYYYKDVTIESLRGDAI